jgi:protein tyrosine/serine phosphatase
MGDGMQDRVKQLEGVVNFRDFGGYLGFDGAMLRRGLLFRSAHFAEASDGDLDALDQLGVGAVTDLRRPEEREAQPNRWPRGGVFVHQNDEGQVSKPPHVAFLEEAELSAEAVRGYMLGTYGQIPYEPRYLNLFSAFLRGLVQTQRAGVVHCAAGKDRTGIIVAVTQLLLGVDRAAVYADYELTNTVVDLEARLPRMRSIIEARYGVAVTDEVARPMVGVHADYLKTALDAIEGRSGSIELYARTEMGLSEAEISQLRGLLLQ